MLLVGGNPGEKAAHQQRNSKEMEESLVLEEQRYRQITPRRDAGQQCNVSGVMDSMKGETK